MQNSVNEGTRGKNRSVSRTGPALDRWGNWSRGPIPIQGQLSESEEKHLRPRVKQLICGSLNGMRLWQTLPQPYIPQTEMLVSWKGQQLGVKGLWSNPRARAAVDCGETDWGDVRNGGKCLWRKARQLWKQGDTAESGVGVGAVTIASLAPLTSIGSWTVERLAHQIPDTLSYRVGPYPGRPLSAWCAKQQRRTPGKGAL